MGTWIIGIILSCIVAAILRTMVRNKKNGKSVQCGGSCKHCGGGCH